MSATVPRDASGHVVMLATACDRAEAERLAELLVERRLAACVQLSPIDSVYRWRGAIERAAEVLLMIKTRADLAEPAAAALKAAHSYETPEIIVLPVIGGSADYLAWIDSATDEAL